MREKLYRFMAGRNGLDQLGMALSAAIFVLIVVNLFLRSFLLELAILALLVIYIFRTFSRNLSRRRAENQRYLKLRDKLTGGIRSWWDRMKQRKDYAFFRCPSCRCMLRVPRGKGRIRVTCRKCGLAFEKKT